ncbi:bifunctional ornithine acetyltransferase/N-acetylglutamate synthase [Prosthecochloris sp. ZM]|uniref:bifunctional glutamate N-acetyltransferase/amino-acid acetyltransferase ArgJ n=1 Tax=Prosthecochloris sp. ZM TaxID=2283143 RepID=UPI000DF795CE|nr:bifunctional glutamate N-acetyltransferase/amino-acid acetyltransferase ArgJ [Prosthecochloris sp. ZM]RDD30351.1 bifunctional ornithine acetyltransferase/N-acetylglutamate synthase [Prosthecochloris sp. ZM]
MILKDVNTLQKAFAAVETLAAQTAWPDAVTLVKPEHADNGGFWPQGFRAAGVSAGIKSKRKDLMAIVSDKPASAAAVFTTNLCCAAPVVVSKAHLECSASSMRAIICNSGNANAATGDQGMRDARSMAASTSALLGVKPEEILVASTGVIGVPLPLDKILAALDMIPDALERESCFDAAEAIMTTDTFPKFFAVDVRLSNATVRIAGIAKGSGMICPNMATMLGFLVTDASIEPELLKLMLQSANAESFNAITVDGDTSTNDMVAILAGGNGPCIQQGSPDAELFYQALRHLMIFLAKLIVIDGEGATKLVEISVEGARDNHDAERAARTVANSSLVKTAIHGEDANWGRIIGALGRSGAHFNPEDLVVRFNDLAILEPGFISNFSEDEAKTILSKNSYVISIVLGQGSGKSVIWTCDLSKEYVEINGSYRT